MNDTLDSSDTRSHERQTPDCRTPDYQPHDWIIGAPMMLAAVGFVGGIAVDQWCKLPTASAAPTGLLAPFAAYVCLLIFVSAAATIRIIRGRYAVVLVLLASAAAGASIHLAHARSPNMSGIERFATPQGRIARVTGTIITPPRLRAPPPHPFDRWTFGSDRTSFVLRAESVEGTDVPIEVSSLLVVSVREPPLDLRVGERVEIFGLLRSLRGPHNPESFDWASHQRRQGIVAQLMARHADNVRRVDEPMALPPTNIRTWWQGIRSKLSSMLVDDAGDAGTAGAGFLQAVILGQRSRIDRQLNEVFIRAGCAHYIAVSGIHVAIVLGLIRICCLILSLSPRATSGTMLLGILLYVLVAEPRPSILRAGAMAVLYCLSRLLGRGTASLNWLGVAAIVLLSIRPGFAFDVGFQLSFAAVLGVTRLSPVIAERARQLRGYWRRWRFGEYAEQDDQLAQHALRTSLGWRPHVRRLIQWLRMGAMAGFGVSLSAWLAVLPIVAQHFHRVQPWSPLTSVLMFPFVALLMMLGFVKILFAALLPSVSPFVGAALVFVNDATIGLATKLSLLPGADTAVATAPAPMVVCYYAAIILFMWPATRSSSPLHANAEGIQPTAPARPRWVNRAFCAVTVLVVAQGIAWGSSLAHPGRLVVTVLDVGAGLATVIQTPGGECILYDSGSMSPYDAGEYVVLPFLRNRGVARVTRAYVSHANLDHYSGFPTIASRIPIDTLLIGGYFDHHLKARSAAKHLLDLMRRRGVDMRPISTETDFETADGVRIECLWPPSNLGEDVAANDTSTVLRIHYAGHSILLTGDIEAYAQRRLLERGHLEADVLMLPHHGGVESTTVAFIRAVNPSAVIRSSHQRMADTTNGLAQAVAQAVGQAVGNVFLYNTADHGAITVEVDESGIRISPMHPGDGTTVSPPHR